MKNQSTPIVLLHGALGSASQLEILKKELSPHYPEVFSLNFSGHGGSEIPENLFSIPLFSEDLGRFLEMENLQKVDLFGYSMGGYVALDFAKEWPEKVRRVACLATKFDWKREAAEREAAMLDAEKWLVKIPQFAADLAARHAPADWKSVVSKTAEMMRNLGSGAALTAGELAETDCPTLIIRGELDAMVSEEESRWASRILQKGQFISLKETKHPFEKVDIEKLVNELLIFFKRRGDFEPHFLER